MLKKKLESAIMDIVVLNDRSSSSWLNIRTIQFNAYSMSLELTQITVEQLGTNTEE
jgi:hypothetical protein